MKEWFATAVSAAASDFYIRVCFIIRHSDFVICISLFVVDK
jgi:hypothetical protein